jgi:hypothetical protein
MIKVHVDHGPAKKRTPESREAEAKKFLESRPPRPAADPNNPKHRGPMPTVLSPAERGGKKKAEPVVAETKTTGSAEPAEVVTHDKPKKAAKKGE